MPHLRLFPLLLLFFVSDATETTETTTVSTIEDDQAISATENQKVGSALPPFIIILCCRSLYCSSVLLISDHWVLGDATSLSLMCKPYLNEVNGCLIWGELNGNASTVKCKKIIVHEQYGYTHESYKYNIGAVSSEEALSSWSGLTPWPQRRGFTDECTKLSLYSFLEKSRCTTLKVAKECPVGPYFGKKPFCWAKESRDEVKNGVAVCDNVAVGLFSDDINSFLIITKIEDYYTFIHETTNIEVPFQSSPFGVTTEKQKKEPEDVEEGEKGIGPGSYDDDNYHNNKEHFYIGGKAPEEWIESNYGQMPENFKSMLQRFLGKARGKETQSSATSLEKPWLLFLFLTLAQLLLNFLY